MLFFFFSKLVCEDPSEQNDLAVGHRKKAYKLRLEPAMLVWHFSAGTSSLQEAHLYLSLEIPQGTASTWNVFSAGLVAEVGAHKAHSSPTNPWHTFSWLGLTRVSFPPGKGGNGVSSAASRMLWLLTHPLVTVQEQSVAPISNKAL